MDMVVEDDDPHHHPQTEQLRFLTLEPRVILTVGGGEGGREEGEREYMYMYVPHVHKCSTSCDLVKGVM